MRSGAPDLSARIAAAFDRHEPVRIEEDGGFRLFIDHPVPLLAVHRCAGTATGDPALDARGVCPDAHRLVTALPAYLIASDGTAPVTVGRIAAVADALRAAAGPPLVIEVWSPLDAAAETEVDPFHREPGFTIYHGPLDTPGEATVDALCDALSGIEIAGQGAQVDRVSTGSVAPPGLPPLEAPPETLVVGLAVDAVFLNAREDEFYPALLGRLRDALGPALRDAAEAARPRTLVARTHLEPAALVVDAGLSAVSDQYGFLLQVTPVNTAAAWADFQGARCEQAPEFLYRPLTFDPDAVRRDLFALPVDAVEDPVVADLLRERRDEIEAQVRMMLDRETAQFLPGSLRVYGAPDRPLVALAREIVALLNRQPPASAGEEVVGATAFAAAARAEIAHYAERSEHVPVGVEIRDDIPGSLMVSSGRLLVGAAAQVPARRVTALLAHEIGTHVLTYANGRAQPLAQFHHGLAGYEDLQEGLAVLGEWLVGGLTGGRFRTLAARVIGAHALADGAPFIDTFRLLRDAAGLSDRAAFTVTTRLYRGGGLTKDIVYLRGLRDLLEHLARDGAYWELFLGKIALRHLPAVRDLRQRGVLLEPPLRPRYAADPAALRRLDRARRGLTVLDLLSSE